MTTPKYVAEHCFALKDYLNLVQNGFLGHLKFFVHCESVDHHFMIESYRFPDKKIYARIFQSFEKTYTVKEGLKFVTWMNFSELEQFIHKLEQCEARMHNIVQKLCDKISLSPGLWFEKWVRRIKFEVLYPRKVENFIELWFEGENPELLLKVNIEDYKFIENFSLKWFHGFFPLTFSLAILASANPQKNFWRMEDYHETESEQV
jgi:hypothetical protein